MAKKHRKSSRKSSFSSGLMANVIGVGGYIAYESIVKPKIPLAATSLNIAELIAGVMLAKKAGVLGNIGKTAIVLNTYQLIQPLIAGQLASLSN